MYVENNLKCPQCSALSSGSEADIGVVTRCPKCRQAVVMEWVGKHSPRKERTDVHPCPRCAAPIRMSDRRCPECNALLTRATIRGMKVKPDGPEAGAYTLALVVGTLLAGGLGMAWGVLTMATEVRLGVVAWGIGLLVAAGMAAVTKERSGRLGGMAVILALSGIVLGNLLIADWAFERLTINRAASSRQTMAMFVSDQRRIEGRVEADFHRWIVLDSEGGDTGQYRSRLDEFEITRGEMLDLVDAMPPEERKALAHGYLALTIAETSYAGRLVSIMSNWDGLWLILAMLTSFKIGSGVGDS